MRRDHWAQWRRQDHVAATALRYHPANLRRAAGERRIAPILALGAGFVGDMSGRENVLVGGAMLGLRRSEILRRVPAVAPLAGVGPLFDPPGRLYFGRTRLPVAVFVRCSRGGRTPVGAHAPAARA